MPSPRNSRARLRARLIARALARSLRPRRPPAAPARILVAHRLLLGDTLMLAALFAALREAHPGAEIATTVAPEFLPLFARRPYGVAARAYDPRDARGFAALAREADAAGGYDLALVPGDNRHALLARALGARWVVAFAGAHEGAWKDRLCDELRPWPEAPTALADIFSLLAGNAMSLEYKAGDWPAPPHAPFSLPPAPYAVLHVGAGSPLRHWVPERWRALAAQLEARRMRPVWSLGPRDGDLLAAIDPAGRHAAYRGNLDLAQLWALLAGARLLVCPDTGVAHMGKLVGVPTVCLFGPGSPELFGAGRFWAAAPFVGVGEASFPCRDQATLFGRRIPWVRRCQRSPLQCASPRCMQAIGMDAVMEGIDRVLR